VIVMRGEKVTLHGVSEGPLSIEGEPKGKVGRPWADRVCEREGRYRE